MWPGGGGGGDHPHHCTPSLLDTLTTDTPSHTCTITTACRRLPRTAHPHHCIPSPLHTLTTAHPHHCTPSPLHTLTTAHAHHCTRSPLHILVTACTPLSSQVQCTRTLYTVPAVIYVSGGRLLAVLARQRTVRNHQQTCRLSRFAIAQYRRSLVRDGQLVYGR